MAVSTTQCTTPGEYSTVQYSTVQYSTLASGLSPEFQIRFLQWFLEAVASLVSKCVSNSQAGACMLHSYLNLIWNFGHEVRQAVSAQTLLQGEGLRLLDREDAGGGE